nr:hypothetical protein GCM10010200_088890 [Actinomadura rugatobispora]
MRAASRKADSVLRPFGVDGLAGIPIPSDGGLVAVHPVECLESRGSGGGAAPSAGH